MCACSLVRKAVAKSQATESPLELGRFNSTETCTLDRLFSQVGQVGPALGPDGSTNMSRRMRLSTPGRFIVALLLGVTIASSLSACSETADPLTVSYSPFEPTALVWIAEDQGFFGENGLDVTFKKYDTGPAALDAMLGGEANIAVGIGEFPVVGRVLQGQRMSILASIARSELIYTVARKDRGIDDVEDLKGKRVGTTLGTIAEYFLRWSLELHGLSANDVTIVDVKAPADWVNAVVDGEIDAICTAEPYASSAATALGSNGVKWSAHGEQLMYGLVVSSDEWLEEDSDVLSRFLESLVQAEEYAAENAIPAQAIVQKSLGLDSGYLEQAWSRNEFQLSLDESLIASMENEARWMMRINLTSEREMPNFADQIHEEGLAATKPEAVHIIR